MEISHLLLLNYNKNELEEWISLVAMANKIYLICLRSNKNIINTIKYKL